MCGCNECFDTSNITIPQGPAGPAGPQGATGATGPQGDSGMVYETFITDPAVLFALNTGDQTITGATSTFPNAGNYQIPITRYC